jgi:hypothetical protein
MMFRILIFCVSVFTLVACQGGHRRPSSESGQINLQKEVDRIYADVQDEGVFNLSKCSTYLKDTYQDVLSLPPSRFDFQNAKDNWQKISETLWLIRLKLREKLQSFAKLPPTSDDSLRSCSDNMHDGFRLSRWVEDYLAENFTGEPQDFKAGDEKFVADAHFKPTPLQGLAPWVEVNPQYKQATIRSGDIILSRGNAYSSAGIARIGQVDSQFSHLAFIYIEGDGSGREYTIDEALKNKNVKVLEAHIEVGSTIRPLSEYFQDGNARNLILRYNDGVSSALMAHRSAKWSYDYIQTYRKKSFDANPIYPLDDVNHNVPYNFRMDISNSKNPTSLFCSQVAYVGFMNNNITIPYFMSSIDPNLSLVKRLGITGTKVFAPGDMELDPRFEVVAEYRNLRKMKGLRIRDMVLTGLFRMMSEGYEFKPLPTWTAESIGAWALRHMEFKFMKDKLPDNMGIKVMTTMFALNKVAKYFEVELQNVEAERPGLPLSLPEGQALIQKLADEDKAHYLNGEPVKFYNIFRPAGLTSNKAVPKN